MKKICAVLMILALVWMPFGTALAAGMPEAHGVTGRDFGRMVSELAKSYPGAVADHMKAVRPPNGYTGMAEPQFRRVVSHPSGKM